MTISPGTRLGHYEIRSLLGTGGMGEVYLAKDMQLGRRVAIKILPSDFTEDEDRLNRFLQEARTTSALAHANIITIYENGCQDSTYFIVMEFIDGLTLRQHMAQAPMKIVEAIDIAIQVASALAAAHKAGITHRDIKPNNIMIKSDGFVKVLDFGLAKLAEWALEVDKEDPTPFLINTDPGLVMGTPNYMSPEQARGYAVDVRTDLWSLGCVLYEMVTGRMPFEGSTPNDVIAQILEREPLPLSRFAREVPEALEWIVMKALTREREERYQTAKEMLADLKKLRRKLEAESEMKHPSVLPGRTIQAISSSLKDETPVVSEIAQDAASVTTATQQSGSSLSTEPIVTGVKAHAKLLLLVSAVLVIVVGVVTLAFYKPTPPPIQPAAARQNIKSTRLVTEPGAYNAAISADGNFVVYVAPAKNEEGHCLWSMQISQGTSREITKPLKGVNFYGTIFSPNGDIVYYLVHDLKTELGTLYQVPANGGREPKKIIDYINSFSLSQDGKQFAFIRWYASTEETALMIANIDGTGEPRKLTTRKGGNMFSPGIAWSPDGNKIVCAVGTSSIGNYTSLVEIPVEGGAEKPFSSHKWFGLINRMFWLKDGSGLVLIAAETEGGSTQIWHVSYPQGEANNVTNNLVDYSPGTLGVAKDSTIIAEAIESSLSMWVVSLGNDKAGPRFIPTDKYDGCGGMSWTPDKRIVYGAKRGDNYDIWIMKEDGSENKPLTFDAHSDYQPRVTHDGQYIVFTSNREGSISNIWRMDIDGGRLRQLTQNEGYSPTCSADGKWVVYVSRQDGQQNLWKVPIEGGEPKKISDKTLSYPEFSPTNANWILCMYYGQDLNIKGQPVLISAEDGHIIKQIDYSQTAVTPPGWMPDGQSLFYVDGGYEGNDVWSQNISDNKRVQLTKLRFKQVGCIEISQDKKVVLSLGSFATNLILIKEFRPS